MSDELKRKGLGDLIGELMGLGNVKYIDGGDNKDFLRDKKRYESLIEEINLRDREFVKVKGITDLLDQKY